MGHDGRIQPSNMLGHIRIYIIEVCTILETRGEMLLKESPVDKPYARHG